MADDTTKAADADDEIIVIEEEAAPEEKPDGKSDTKPAKDDTPGGDGAVDKPDAGGVEDPDEDDDEDDDRLAEGLGEDDDNPNRKKRLKRRQMQKAARERAERQLAFLEAQNAQMAERLASLEGNVIRQSETTLDQQIAEAKAELARFSRIMAGAMEAGNGEDATAALDLRDRAKDRIAELEASKANLLRAKDAPAQVDPKTTSLAGEWMAANPWYNPKGADENSQITNIIDKQVAAEGYLPSTPAYWRELSRRLNERFGAAPTGRKVDGVAPGKGPKTPPPIDSTREHVQPGNRVKLSAARIDAIKQAGKWEDPALRNAAVKAYLDYDKNNPTA